MVAFLTLGMEDQLYRHSQHPLDTAEQSAKAVSIRSPTTSCVGRLERSASSAFSIPLAFEI